MHLCEVFVKNCICIIFFVRFFFSIYIKKIQEPSWANDLLRAFVGQAESISKEGYLIAMIATDPRTPHDVLQEMGFW